MMEEKFLIMLMYYERPNFVRRALASLLPAGQLYPHWDLAVVDDGSVSNPIKPIVEKYYPDLLPKTRFYYTPDLPNYIPGNSHFGSALNKAMQQSDASIVFTLCDDDLLLPTIMVDYARFFRLYPRTVACYGKVLPYDAMNRRALAPGDCILNDRSTDNRYGPVNGALAMDMCQVAWRMWCCKSNGAWFPDRGLVSFKDEFHIDAYFYNELNSKCGPMVPADFYVQCKGMHPQQITEFKKANNPETPVDQRRVLDLPS